MTDFSPAAKAVLDAFFDADDSRVINGGDWIQDQEAMLAAALRAVAEQLVPQVYLPERFYSGEDFEEYARQMTRLHLLAIADELEGNEPSV